MEHNEEKAKTTAVELKSTMENADLHDHVKTQQRQIETLTQELEELRKGRQPSTVSVTSSNPIIDPPKVINTSNVIPDITTAAPAHGEISYTMNAMLEKYEMLDEDSKRSY